MFYTDRNRLIAEILNEDMAFDGPYNEPRRRASIIHNTNSEDPDDNNHSRGGQRHFTGDTATTNLIFRLPSDKELKAAENAADMRISGDYQMGKTAVISKILFDFDILHKIYRSKVDNWNDLTHNAVQVDKLLSRIKQLFNSKVYSPDTPIEQVSEDLENSTDALEEKFGVRIPELIGRIPSWKHALVIDPKSKSSVMPSGFNPIIMQNLIELVGDEKAKKIYPDINDFLVDAAPNYSTPKSFARYIERCQTLRAVLNEPLLKKFFDRAMTSPNVTDVEELVLFLTTNLKNIREEKRTGYTMAIIHNNARKAIQKADLMMKRKGFKQGVRNIQDMFEYLEEYRPETFAYICHTYGLTKELIDQFTSYNDFCNWLYGDPNRLAKIYLSARIEGRGGARMNVDYSKLDKQERQLQKDIQEGKPRGRSKRAYSVEEREQKLKEYEKEISQLDKELASLSKNDPEYKEKHALRAKLRKKWTDSSWQLRKYKESIASGERDDTIKSVEDKLNDVRTQKEELRDAEYNRLKDEVERERFERRFSKTNNRFSTGALDIGEGYVTMAFSFDLNSESRNGQLIAEWIEQQLDKFLNNKEEKAEKERLINVSYTPGKYEGKMRMYPCTRFEIDYPKSSHLYSLLKSKDEDGQIEYVKKLVKKITTAVKDNIGIQLNLVETDKNHSISIMSEEESPNYRFSDFF